MLKKKKKRNSKCVIFGDFQTKQRHAVVTVQITPPPSPELASELRQPARTDLESFFSAGLFEDANDFYCRASVHFY